MKKSNTPHSTGSLEVFIHLLVWVFLFGFPHMLMVRGTESIPLQRLLRMMGPPLLLAVVFYVNYLVLVPKYLLKHKLKRYITANVGAVIAVFFLLQGWFWVMEDGTDPRAPQPNPIERQEAGRPAPQHKAEQGESAQSSAQDESNGRLSKPGIPQERKGIRRHQEDVVDIILFRIRDLVLFVFAAALAAVIRTSRRWHLAELSRQKAELKQIETELQSLRNQINPHFLLNTLNNIYALIAFNTEKAQEAVQELSKLLRHLLYENREMFTDLTKEIEFLRNYVALMQIRLSSNVELIFETHIPEGCTIRIAPLIFVSLIENAFKHGVSPTAPSFIHISISVVEPSSQVVCQIRNSNFPKLRNDVSGSGVGLDQVQRRLELIYPRHYEWNKGVSDDSSCYYSELTIDTLLQNED